MADLSIETGIQPSEFFAEPRLIEATEMAIYRRQVEAQKQAARGGR